MFLPADADLAAAFSITALKIIFTYSLPQFQLNIRKMFVKRKMKKMLYLAILSETHPKHLDPQ